MERIEKILNSCINGMTLQKVILSKPSNENVRRLSARFVKIKNETVLQLETVFNQGGAAHENISLDKATSRIMELFANSYGQINIIDCGGNAEGRFSKNGRLMFYSKIKKTESVSNVQGQNRDKEYILSPNTKYDFLVSLGIQDSNGRVHDKKQSKFRQINKFLEIIKDTEIHLPKDNIVIWDLCCGKSYLSFAVYYYFRFILNKNIKMYGVDLKKDVIEYCAKTADELGFEGLHFLHGDINETVLPEQPHMVMSLHACDIATDIVIGNAVKNGAKVILSTPCCQHELASRIKNDALDFIIDYPILKQKLSALVTDALRCEGLKSSGYSVTCLEFIDPDETPKNMMIKAIKTQKPQSYEKYSKLCEAFNAVPHFIK